MFKLRSQSRSKQPQQQNPIFVREGFDLLGGFTKDRLLQLLHLDPLNGAEFPVTSITRDIVNYEDEVPMENLQLEDPTWRAMVMRMDTSLRWGLGLGIAIGVSAALLKTAGNIFIAATGVVVLPITLGERKIALDISQYARYGLKKLFDKSETGWYRLTTMADKIGIPKSKPAVRVEPIYKGSQKILLRDFRNHKDYYTKEVLQETKNTPFVPHWMRYSGPEFYRRSCLKFAQWYNDHPLKKFAVEFRNESRMLPNERLPLTIRLGFLPKWLFPKRKAFFNFFSLYIKWFYTEVRQYTLLGPYVFLFLNLHLYLWQKFGTLFKDEWIDMRKGYLMTNAFITGSWNFWWFTGSLFGRPPFLTIPWKHIPGAIIGYLGVGFLINMFLLSWEDRSEADYNRLSPDGKLVEPPVEIPYKQIYEDYKETLKKRKQELKDHFENNAPYVSKPVGQSILDMASKYDPYIKKNFEVMAEIDDLLEEMRYDVDEPPDPTEVKRKIIPFSTKDIDIAESE